MDSLMAASASREWFKKRGYLTLGGGKTFHPRAKKDDKSYMDGADSWDLDKVMARPF